MPTFPFFPQSYYAVTPASGTTPPDPVPLDDRLVAFMGASLMQRNNTLISAGSTPRFYSNNWAFIVNANNEQGMPWKLRTARGQGGIGLGGVGGRGSNMGYGGQDITRFESNVLPVMKASKAKYVIVEIGRNGIPDLSAAQHLEIYRRMNAQLRAQGRTIIHWGMFPRVAWVRGDNNVWNIMLACDAGQRADAAQYGELYIDNELAMRDPATPDLPYSLRPGALPDGTHPEDLGGRLLEAPLRAALVSLFGSGMPDYSALAAAPTNKNLNPYMTGTSGVVIAGATGQVPTNYRVSNSSNSNASTVASIVTIDGRRWIKTVITPSGVAGGPPQPSVILRDPFSVGATSSDGFVEFMCRLRIPSLAGVVNYELRQSNQGSTVVDVRSHVPWTTVNNDPPSSANYPAPAWAPTDSFDGRLSVTNWLNFGATMAPSLVITVNPAHTAPIEVFTTEWIIQTVDQIGDFPELIYAPT